MIATLTFNLPEETTEHQTAIDGQKWKGVVSDLNTHFRDALKHGHSFRSANEAFEYARQSIHDLMAADNLSLE